MCRRESVEDPCSYLLTQIPDLDNTVLDNFRKHRIDGQVFLQLNDEYLREVTPLLGDRIKLKTVLAAVVEPASVTESPLCSSPHATNSSTPCASVMSDSVVEVCCIPYYIYNLERLRELCYFFHRMISCLREVQTIWLRLHLP